MSQPAENEAAEKAVLGSILMAPNVIPDVAELVSADDFYKPRHTILFTTASRMFAKGEPVDATTIVHELQREGNLGRVGGAPYVADLLQATPTTANVLYYAKLVVEAAKLRGLAAICARGSQLVASGGVDYQEVIDQFERFLDDSNLTNSQQAQGFNDLFEEWVEWQNRPVDALPTPWPLVNDKLAGGFHKKRLYIVAARPGCGKSVLGLNVTTQFAKCGYKGMVFSLEMPKMEVMSRMLAAGAHASYGEITRHEMSVETDQAVHRFAGLYPEFQSNIKVDDQTDHTIESIMAMARAQKRKGLDFVFIDYVQLLNSSQNFALRYEELGMMSKLLHQMAVKLDIAILLAAQSGRQADQKDHVPTMSDLRESGNLEADADVVLLLARAADERMPDMPLVNISIVKNRTGEGSGIVRLPEHFESARIGA